MCLFISTLRLARRWFAWRGAWSGCSAMSYLIWMRVVLFMMARRRRMNRVLLRLPDIESVLAKGSLYSGASGGLAFGGGAGA